MSSRRVLVFAFLFALASPGLASARRPPLDMKNGAVFLGLARDRLHVRITGDAAVAIERGLSRVRLIDEEWRRGTSIACGVVNQETECRIEVSRSGQLAPPRAWFNYEPSGTFARLTALEEGSVTVTERGGLVLAFDETASTQLALWTFGARGPLECRRDMITEGELTIRCSVAIDAQGRARRPVP